VIKVGHGFTQFFSCVPCWLDGQFLGGRNNWDTFFCVSQFILFCSVNNFFYPRGFGIKAVKLFIGFLIFNFILSQGIFALRLKNGVLEGGWKGIFQFFRPKLTPVFYSFPFLYLVLSLGIWTRQKTKLAFACLSGFPETINQTLFGIFGEVLGLGFF